MMDARVTIRQDRLRPLKNRHPWVFSGAVLRAHHAVDGQLVTLESEAGEFLGRGYWNSQSQIQVRVLTWEDEAIDSTWWYRRLMRSTSARDGIAQPQEGRRLVHAESDGLPGLIVDQYGDVVVLQALTRYIDEQKLALAQQIQDLTQATTIFERSDVDVRRKEGLGQASGVLIGPEPPPLVRMERPSGDQWVDIRHGHKTGAYLDQRQNQATLAQFLNTIHGDNPYSALNLFSYTGGFGLGLRAHVTHVDSSQRALELAAQNDELNAGTTLSTRAIEADVFDALHQSVAASEQYDVVILDPPKFASGHRQVDRASRGYKDLNLNAFRLLKPGGHLVTYSCSGAISRDLFQKIVFGAMIDSGREGAILREYSAPEDHPVALAFPEGFYLKGLLIQVY
jgi:23S rRNA (cytosine1962-C5)-methyltransferase